MPSVSQGGDSGGGRGAAAYKGLRSRQSPHVLGEINVVPLVDVVLVLLLVFMITAPMMSRGIDVELPVANQPDISPEDRVTVAVNKDGRVYVGERPVNIELLEGYLRQLMGGLDKRVVYLRADESLRYGQVIAVVDRIRRAEIQQIGFAYDAPKDGP